MILTTSIIPLKFEPNLDNQSNIDYALKEGKEPPKKKFWDEVTYNAQSIEHVGDTEVKVSSIEKMKSSCQHNFEIGKPALVDVKLFPWFMDGKKGISATIMSVAKS